MANEEHIAELEKGAASWNPWHTAWREKNPDIRPDFSRANFGRADAKK
jgi:hypothetical protein